MGQNRKWKTANEDTAVLNHKLNVSEIMSVSNDQRLEQLLMQNQSIIDGLLEMCPFPVSISSIGDGRYLLVNQRFCQIAGYTMKEVIGHTATELGLYADPNDRAKLIELAQKNPEAIQNFESRIKGKGGVPFQNSILVKIIRFHGQDCVLTMTTYSLSLSQTQQALRQSQNRFRNILNSITESYYEVDLQGHFTFFNNAISSLLGYTPEELQGMSYRTYTTAEDAQIVYQAFNEVYKGDCPVGFAEYKIQRKDGVMLQVETSICLLRDNLGNAVGFYGLLRDRTKQKQAEEALRQSEERYRLLVNNANDGIYITQEGRIKFHNPKTAAITGYSNEALNGMLFVDLVHPEDKEVIYEAQQRKLAEGQSPGVFSFRILNKEQEIRWIELSAIGITWEERPAALNFLRDVSRQKTMEAQLLQSRKMEAVGTLAGGIAHDFNNLLMGIEGNITIALMDLEKEHPLYEKLIAIEQYVKAGSNLTRQLLGTARNGTHETKPTDISELVDASAELFGRTKKEVRIHKRFEKGLWTVEVDHGQIAQVLLNLFVNAWQAMPTGGDLFLETQNVTLDEHFVKPYGVPPGNFVKLMVTDTGVGIDAKNLKRIFDPFFTTKNAGMGTGLGLYSAYGIIANHGGIITAYSEKGSGATFNIYLPASAKQVIVMPEKKKEVMKGHETLLLVDDEKGIVEVAALILQRLGYKVMVAYSGEEAVEIYRHQPDQIDLVIVDMIMPGMSGSDTFNALREINPDAKVILSSGYSVNDQAKQILDKGCNGFIQKPFSMQHLSVKLRGVLDNRDR